MFTPASFVPMLSFEDSGMAVILHGDDFFGFPHTADNEFSVHDVVD